MKPFITWLMVALAGVVAAYLIGRADSSLACVQHSYDNLANSIDIQLDMDRQNTQISASQVTAAEQRANVTAAIKQEQLKHAKTTQDQPGCFVSIGDVQLLNAQRSNQMPDTLYPRFGAGDYSAASTVSQQDLIDGDLDCAARYNVIKDRCNSLIARVKVLKEALANAQ